MRRPGLGPRPGLASRARHGVGAPMLGRRPGLGPRPGLASTVGLAGFEPAASCSQSTRATKLRHSP